MRRLTPVVLWAERNDRIFITVEVTDSKEPAVNITDEGVLTVSTTGGAEGARYEVKLELLHTVNSKARRARKPRPRLQPRRVARVTRLPGSGLRAPPLAPPSRRSPRLR